MLAFLLFSAAPLLNQAEPASIKSAVPPLPEAFSSFGAAIVDRDVYVYGGHIAPTHNYAVDAVTGKFRRYNLDKNGGAWEELPGGPPIQGLALVAHGGKVYRIGGMQPRNKATEKASNFSLDSVAVFDPKVGKWADFVPLPEGRSSHDAAVVGDSIVVIGGWTMNGAEKRGEFVDTALVLDLSHEKPKWKTVPQPFKRRAFNVGVSAGKVYAVGGMNADEEIERTVDVFDPATLTWSKAPDLPGVKRNGFASAVCASDDKIVASPSDGKVYMLTGAKDAQWTEVGELKDRRIVHRLVPIGDGRILALGGANTVGNLASVELIDVGGKK